MQEGLRETELRTFSSFEQAEDADRAYYSSLSPQQRVDLVLDIVARHRESMGEAGKDLREFIELLNSHRVEFLVVRPTRSDADGGSRATTLGPSNRSKDLIDML